MAAFTHAPLDILIVEDEFLIRWAISSTLMAAGHRVTEASDAASAVAILRTGPAPDVVLLDYRLPDTSGLSLLADVRALAPNSAVVMMTADQTAEMRRAADLGVMRVIEKPFDMSDVEPALIHAFDTRLHAPERSGASS
jgi:DNA-binding NtrC family response regulator